MSKVLCIIPARKGSRELKNKNIKLLENVPLVMYPFNVAKKIKHINDIAISSDTNKYLNLFKDKKIIKILRPKKLASSNSKIIDVINHALKKINKNYEYLVLLEPTSPLTSYTELNKAFKFFINNKKNIDFLVSVISIPKYHSSYAIKLNNKRKVKIRKFPKNSNRQKQSKEFFLSGNFYIAKTEKLLKNKSWISNRTHGYEIKKSIHTDIDNINDFIFAQGILKNGLFKKIK